MSYLLALFFNFSSCVGLILLAQLKISSGPTKFNEDPNILLSLSIGISPPNHLHSSQEEIPKLGNQRHLLPLSHASSGENYTAPPPFSVSPSRLILKFDSGILDRRLREAAPPFSLLQRRSSVPRRELGVPPRAGSRTNLYFASRAEAPLRRGSPSLLPATCIALCVDFSIR